MLCLVGHFHNITLDDNGSDHSGTAGSATVLQGSTCSINLADIVVGLSAGNPNAYTVSLAVTFSQAYMVGNFEVWGDGLDSAQNASGQADLGAVAISYGPDFTLSISPAVVYGEGGDMLVTLTGRQAFRAGFSGQINPWQHQRLPDPVRTW